MEKNNNKNILYIVIALVVVICIVLVFVFKDTNTNTNNNNKNNEIVNEVIKFPFEGYEYTFSNNCSPDVVEEENIIKLKIYNNKEKWGGDIELIPEEKFSYFKNDDIDGLETRLKNLGHDIRDKRVSEIDNNKIFSFSIYYENNIGSLNYMKAYDGYIYEILIYDNDGKTLNDNYLKTIVGILNTAKKIEE